MACFTMTSDGDSDPKDREEMSRHLRDMFGPNAVDNAVRQAISVCWMCLPEDKRNLDEVDRQLRRILDRALQNAREDRSAFGIMDAG